MTRPLAVAAAALAFLGCGPIQSTAFLLDADLQLEAARTAGAETHAPYEWTAANLYLHKAREEVGYSDFQVALDFAEKAAKYATQAREFAVSATRIDSPPPPVPVAP